MKKVDLIWDNPPYTSPETKERVLRALVGSGKPFAMLLPISILHVGFVRDIVDADEVPAARTLSSTLLLPRHAAPVLELSGTLSASQVQTIIPRRVHVRKTGKEEVPFKYLCWFCHRMGLPRDLYLIDDTEDGGGGD